MLEEKSSWLLWWAGWLVVGLGWVGRVKSEEEEEREKRGK